jgi:hypothetical protein
MSRFIPHFPESGRVFDAADMFKQPCLLHQRSLLTIGH